MHLPTDRGVPPEERQRLGFGGLADWDAARIFLEVARSGSFRSAAERLGLSINALRRRVADFETQTGATLLTRGVRGSHLTDEGALMVAAVERMEAASFDLLRASLAAGSGLSGEIRVAVSESVGTFWVAPRLAEFQQSFPNIQVNLQCSMHSADVSRHEADIAIDLARPESLDAKLVKLGRLHLMLFAGQKYLDTFGAPKSVDELIKHRLVIHESAARETLEGLFPGHAERDLLVMKTNVSSANYWAVANGAGIGIFPSYAAAFDQKMIPLDIGRSWSSDIWLSYHAGNARVPKIRNTIDWLIKAFNPAKYPWFADEFLHPREFHAVYMGEPLTHLFGGFATVGR
jgi:DNA-binding transcriptional LysR family regulator